MTNPSAPVRLVAFYGSERREFDNTFPGSNAPMGDLALLLCLLSASVGKNLTGISAVAADGAVGEIDSRLVADWKSEIEGRYQRAKAGVSGHDDPELNAWSKRLGPEYDAELARIFAA